MSRKNNIPANPKDEQTQSKHDEAVEVAKISRTSAIVVALITFLGVVVTAVFASPVLSWLQPTETQAVELPSVVATVSYTPVEITLLPPSVTPLIETETIPAPSVEDIPTPASAVMVPVLTENYSTGKAPINITFDARSSYLMFSDGTKSDCVYKSSCSYVWDVRQGSQFVVGPMTGGGVFEYTFLKKGDYTIVVNVCKGHVCEFATVAVTIR